jgi:hypothetical protein
MNEKVKVMVLAIGLVLLAVIGNELWKIWKDLSDNDDSD